MIQTKRIQAEMQPSALGAVELSMRSCSGSTCTDLVVAWDSGSDTFIKLGTRNQENGQIVYYDAGHEDYHDPVTFPSNTVGEPELTYDATKTAMVGDVPTTAGLKVIKGVVQD